jgi:hypothetical protein
MTDRFDFEQKIMQCWSVVEDIKTLNEQIQDFPGTMTADQVANYLLGLETIYQVKFEQLFDMFEQMIREKKIT